MSCEVPAARGGGVGRPGPAAGCHRGVRRTGRALGDGHRVPGRARRAGRRPGTWSAGDRSRWAEQHRLPPPAERRSRCGAARTCCSGPVSSTARRAGCCDSVGSTSCRPRVSTCGGHPPTTMPGSTGSRSRRSGGGSASTGCTTDWSVSRWPTTPWSCGSGSGRPRATSASASPTGGPGRTMSREGSGWTSPCTRRASCRVPCPASGCAWSCLATSTWSPGSVAGRVRPIRTRATARGSVGSPRRSATCRPPTSSRRRTGTGPTSRWATLTTRAGAGLRVEGDPTIGLTVRRWSSAQLDRARHAVELTDEGRLFVNLDAAQHGIGTASCGPGVLPAYRLDVAPVSFAITFAEAGTSG